LDSVKYKICLSGQQKNSGGFSRLQKAPRRGSAGSAADKFLLKFDEIYVIL
jgi:hypothetical protein